MAVAGLKRPRPPEVCLPCAQSTAGHPVIRLAIAVSRDLSRPTVVDAAFQTSVAPLRSPRSGLVPKADRSSIGRLTADTVRHHYFYSASFQPDRISALVREGLCDKDATDEDRDNGHGNDTTGRSNQQRNDTVNMMSGTTYMATAASWGSDLKQSTSSSTATTRTAGASSSSLSSVTDYTTYPLIRQNDRMYLRDPENPYPLPCDLPEIHRQTLRSLMLMRVFGAPFCAPHFVENAPKRVLDLACGSGLWSSMCHGYFSRKGHHDVSFTGLDIVSLAPDLRKQGVNWQFKRHDLRKPRLPFPDGYFDFVFMKDIGMCPLGLSHQASPLSEALRVLKSGGILEVWDSDLVFRTLLPNPAPAPGLAGKDQEIADATATYTFSSATPFAKAQNKYLQDYNSWVEQAFDRRKLTPMPCATIGLSFTSEADIFRSVDSRRIAIPLGEVRWEREGQSKDASGRARKAFTEDQLALRRTCLLTVVQMIESMEPILMEASGKSRDEWDRWWAAMTGDLLQKGGLASGECLEVSAWWGQKR